MRFYTEWNLQLYAVISVLNVILFRFTTIHFSLHSFFEFNALEINKNRNAIKLAEIGGKNTKAHETQDNRSRWREANFKKC